MLRLLLWAFFMSELLAPAGNPQALIGALNAGADAVYLAADRFGARAYADNFTEEEIIEGLKMAHLLHKKIYLTVNILTRQEELSELIAMVSRLYEAGLDGVIVQDLGVLTALHEACPELLLHASTQMSITSPEAVPLLKTLGCSRVVPARELSLEEIRAIRAQGIEVECFIHGAMCYAYSGRCLMSSFLGGRSGNRGRCAGPCHLPYEVIGETGEKALSRCYPLAMKDLCVLTILPELLDANIDSFKIEGRMKKPEYAAGTTVFYRKYIDRYVEWDKKGRKTHWKIDAEDLEELESLYIRTDLSTGYYHERNGRNLITMKEPGYAGADQKLLETIHDRYLTQTPKVEIQGKAVVRTGSRITLTCTAEGTEVLSEGVPAQQAKNRPLTKEDIREKLTRTGESSFDFDHLEVETDGASFVPVSDLNALRRDALSKLEDTLLSRDHRQAKTYREAKCPASKAAKPCLASLVRTREQFEAADGICDLVIADGNLVNLIGEGTLSRKGKGELYAALPPVYRKSDAAQYAKISGNLCARVDGLYVRNLEEIAICQEKDYHVKVLAGPSVYLWNRKALETVSSLVDAMTFPLELSGRELESTFSDVFGKMFLPVYGRAPLMISAGCVRKTAGQCDHRGEHWFSLEDRKNVRFPVLCDCLHCTNTIYNSVPTSLHAEDALLRFLSCRGFLLSFTDESGDQVKQILRGYCGLLDASDPAERKRAGERIAGAMPAGYTTGHFRKGAI